MLQGQKVETVIDGVQVQGIIVGKATTGISQSMIVECTCGFIPNETYPYTHFVMPSSLLKMVDEAEL